MAKERSPNYPYIGLDQALAAARKLWDKEKRTAVSSAVAAQALGYTSLSGKPRVIIAALKQYGLVVAKGDGSSALSESAVNLMVHSKSDQEYVSALRTAALSPPLFKELQKTQPHASDDALRAYLISKKGFSESGAENCVKAYRATIKIANLDGEGYDDPEEPDMITDTPPPLPPKGREASKLVHTFSWPLPGNVTAELRLTGAESIKASQLELLRQYLELAKLAVTTDENAEQ